VGELWRDRHVSLYESCITRVVTNTARERVAKRVGHGPTGDNGPCGATGAVTGMFGVTDGGNAPGAGGGVGVSKIAGGCSVRYPATKFVGICETPRAGTTLLVGDDDMFGAGITPPAG
jgi:hypothetical protein